MSILEALHKHRDLTSGVSDERAAGPDFVRMKRFIYGLTALDA
jgi:hypothetical protein